MLVCSLCRFLLCSFFKFIIELLHGLFDLLPELLQVDHLFRNLLSVLNLICHILALLDHQLASLMILLGLLEIRSV